MLCAQLFLVVPFESWFDNTLSVEKAMDSKEYNMHLTFYEDLKEV